MEWIENFGRMLKRERLSWGMSRGKLQRLSHVDRETIADIENGKILDPDFYEMLNICDVLDTSIYFYLKENSRKDKKHD